MTQASPIFPTIALMAVLALLLLCGGVVHSDFTRRRIPNAYCASIAGLSLLWWIGEGGWAGSIGFARQLVIPLIVAIPLLVLFALRIFAGGDVKLILALLLWVPADGVANMLVLTVLGGGVLAISLKLLHLIFHPIRADTVPYGAAIVAGALVILVPEFRPVLSAAGI